MNKIISREEFDQLCAKFPQTERASRESTQLMDPAMAAVCRVLSFKWTPTVHKCRPVVPPICRPNVELFDDPTHNGQYWGD